MAADGVAELERLYRRDGARLWRSLLGFTGNPDVATDAMAEAFAQALARGSAVGHPDRWVWRAAFRIAAGEMKRRGQLRQIEERVYEIPDPPVDLLRALRGLPPRQRAAIVLRFYAGYETREVAAILGTTSGTVRVHLSQGRRRLRMLLEGEDA